jgi:hypothetical protein
MEKVVHFPLLFYSFLCLFVYLFIYFFCLFLCFFWTFYNLSFFSLLYYYSFMVAYLVEAYCYVKRSRFRFPLESLSFSLTWYVRPRYGPGVDMGSNRNECQGPVAGGKGGRCVGMTISPRLCVDCLKILGTSNSWSPRGPSRTVRR